MKANKQAKKRTKIYNKETGEFYCQLGLKLARGFAHSFQGAVARAFVHNLEGVWFFFSLLIQKELYFFCLPGNEEFAVTVREGVYTPQDIFEQRNH